VLAPVPHGENPFKETSDRIGSELYSAMRFFLAPAASPRQTFSVSRVVSLVGGETRDEETLFGLT